MGFLLPPPSRLSSATPRHTGVEEEEEEEEAHTKAYPTMVSWPYSNR